MRKYSSKNSKDYARVESSLVSLIVDNDGREGNFSTFVHWFDDKERLVSDIICDCTKGGMKINWEEYGNWSGARSYRQFLDFETAINRESDGLDKFFPELFDSMSYLGTYSRMNSPGRITFYRDNLQVFFWSIICEMACRHNYVFTKDKIMELASLCVKKTYYHELFHHFEDVANHLFRDFRYRYLTSEAMAVACSRILVGFEAKNNHSYVSDFLGLAYSYESRGYRDWVLYKSDEQFLKNLISYLELDRSLIQLGQEMAPIAESLLYSVIENPNVELLTR